MSFSLTVLGSSSAIPTSQRFPAAHLLQADERFYLIDCGEGTQIQLRKYKKRLGKINHIFISHLHGDHIFGLFGLISTYSLMGRKTDLHIFSPLQLEEILEMHFTFFGQERLFKILYHPLTGNKSKRILEDGRVTVDTVPLKHSTPCYGFIFREKEKLRNIRREMISFYQIPVREIPGIKQGNDFIDPEGCIIPNAELTFPPPRVRSYAYCTDTTYLPKNADLLSNIDLLYHEATFLHKDLSLAKRTMHCTAAQAAELALKANVKALLIGHFSVRYKQLNVFKEEAEAVFKEIWLAIDGDEYFIDANGNIEVIHFSEDQADKPEN